MHKYVNIDTLGKFREKREVSNVSRRGIRLKGVYRERRIVKGGVKREG